MEGRENLKSIHQWKTEALMKGEEGYFKARNEKTFQSELCQQLSAVKLGKLFLTLKMHV